jgi:4-aminobutyrate aminotransferase-like enzyme
MILATRRGFHGKKGLAGAVTGDEHAPERDPRVRFIDFPIEECCDVTRRRQPIDLAPYQAELERTYDELGDRICCLVTEPYLGGGGSYHPQPEYLQLLERFCRSHDILLILDEIQSNFGRTGPMYAFTHYGIEPDIVCLGKGMGNGVPVSAAVGRADVFAGLDYGSGSDTWSANPLSCAAVVATLDEFENLDVLGQGQKLAAVLEKGLCRLKETGLIRYVRGEGCVWGIECPEVGSHTANQVANACVHACYLGDPQGHALHLLGPLSGCVIRISPPLVMPIDEAEEYLDAMYEILGTLSESLMEG